MGSASRKGEALNIRQGGHDVWETLQLSEAASHTSRKSTRSHCSEVLKTVQFLESESRMVVSRVGGGGMADQ